MCNANKITDQREKSVYMYIYYSGVPNKSSGWTFRLEHNSDGCLIKVVILMYRFARQDVFISLNVFSHIFNYVIISFIQFNCSVRQIFIHVKGA